MGEVALSVDWKTAVAVVWAGFVTIMFPLIGIIYRKHNEEIAAIKSGIDKLSSEIKHQTTTLDGRIDAVERGSVPLHVYEQNRREVREGQIAIYNRIDELGRTLSRIEGKIEK